MNWSWWTACFHRIGAIWFTEADSNNAAGKFKLILRLTTPHRHYLSTHDDYCWNLNHSDTNWLQGTRYRDIFRPFTIDSDYFNYSPQKPVLWPEVLMGNHFNQFCIFIRSSAKKLQIANRFKTIDQLLLKQSMTLAELVGAHVTTNSTACYGCSSSQSSLKLKPHSCLQMHGPCQMQRNGHQMDINGH